MDDCSETGAPACTFSSSPSQQDILDNRPTQKTVQYAAATNLPAYSEQWEYNLPDFANPNTATITSPSGSTRSSFYRGLNYHTVYPDSSTEDQLWSQNLLTAAPLHISPASPNVSLPPLVNPFVTDEYHTLFGTGSTAPVAITHHAQDQDGNETSRVEYSYNTSPYSSNTNPPTLDSAGQPIGTGNATLVRTTTNTYSTPTSPSSSACTGGFYCEPNVSGDLTELLTQHVADAVKGNDLYSQFCYDSAGNLKVEGHGAASGLVTCTSNLPTSTAMSAASYSYDSYGNPTSVVNMIAPPVSSRVWLSCWTNLRNSDRTSCRRLSKTGVMRCPRW